MRLEQLARADADPVRPALVALREDADRWPLGVAARTPGPNLIGVRVDLIEDVDDIDVRELLEALHRLGGEALVVEDHARDDLSPVVIDGLGSRTRNPADRHDGEHGVSLAHR